MTIDERLQFLAASTESLRSSVHELYVTVREQTQQIEAHTTANTDKQLAENIRSLERRACRKK